MLAAAMKQSVFHHSDRGKSRTFSGRYNFATTCQLIILKIATDSAHSQRSKSGILFIAA
jgi:hypothetical protein